MRRYAYALFLHIVASLHQFHHPTTPLQVLKEHRKAPKPVEEPEHSDQRSTSAIGPHPDSSHTLTRAQLTSEITSLQRRLTAQEAESQRHVSYISAMHAWATKTAGTMRQLQEQCETAQAATKAAMKEIFRLRQQLESGSRDIDDALAQGHSLMNEDAETMEHSRKLHRVENSPVAANDNVLADASTEMNRMLHARKMHGTHDIDEHNENNNTAMDQDISTQS